MEGGTPIGSAAAFRALPRMAWIPTDPIGVLVLLRHYWLFILCCGLAGAIALVAAAILIGGPRYVVTAKIMVNLGPEMVGSPLLSAREGTPAAPAVRRPEDSATGVEIFNNPRLVRDVVAQLGEGFFADPPPVTPFQQVKYEARQALRTFRAALREGLVALGIRRPTTELDRIALFVGDALKVEPVRRADVINLILTFPDPHAGEVILDRFITLALAGHVQAYRMPGVTGFFRTARAERRAELATAEARLLALRLGTPNPVWSVADQRPVLIRAESDLQVQQRQVMGAIVATEAEIRRAEAALGTVPGEVELAAVRSRNTTTDELLARLVQLRLELIMQQVRYGESSIEIADIRRQIEALQALVRSEEPYRLDQITTGANQAHQALERDIITRRIDLAGQRGRARQIEEDIRGLRGQLRDIETVAIEIAQLEQDVTRLRRALDLHERGYEDARIAEAMEAVQLSGLRVVMPATAEIIPSSPSLRRNLLLGFAAGLLLAVGVMLLREYLAAQRADAGHHHA